MYIMHEIDTIFICEYFDSSVIKGKSGVNALIYVKNNINFFLNLWMYFVGQSFSKVRLVCTKSSIHFNLQDVGHYNTNETLVETDMLRV